ncbi:AI-2E family transporter [Bradyrhizobium sp. SEMIA]|uniref:AI-2E family transporter n=1 Tax=Bradyrhizobium sp. SEMIA TaxID=2597515 RepID=UPI0018A4AD6D|nr:AI-2E family transporter [Bradyrhizobium sp. SEMIA]QOG23465.1 AI-2E family transporter [Bradyrhizobium sp. SEMIA]
MQLHELTPSNDGGLRSIGTLEPIFDSRVRAITQSAIAIGVVLLALWVARGFLVALTWAALIAIAIWPVYIHFARLISSRRSSLLAPLLFTLLTGLVLLVPLIVVAHQIAQGSGAFLRALDRLRESGIAVPIWLAQLPIAGQQLELWWRTNLSNPDVLREWLRGVNIENLTSWTGALGGALLHRLFLFAITLIALFVAFRDGVWLADRAMTTAGDLIGDPGARLISRIADAIRATVNGTIAAAILKGAAIGVAYVATGVPHPLLFAAVTTALAMVPLGAWIALTTAALILASHSSTLLAPVGLIVFGAAILLIGDNLIHPALIGGTAQLPFLLVLIGILGGVESFGLIGLFLGPVIMAALLTVWREWIGVET